MCYIPPQPTLVPYFPNICFRSKTLIEFGPPLTVPPALVTKFSKGDKKAVEALTTLISNQLQSVIRAEFSINSIEHTTKMLTSSSIHIGDSKCTKLPSQSAIDFTFRSERPCHHNSKTLPALQCESPSPKIS